MKELYAVLLVIVGGIAGLLLFERHTNEVAAQAALRARYEAEVAAAEARNSAVRRVTISIYLEHDYTELFGALDQNNPQDLVPTLAVTRERLRDKKAQIEAARQPIYDAADQLVGAMVEAADERTTALVALVEAAAHKNTLEASQGTSSSSAFFTASAQKKWVEVRARRKPALDQLMERLRGLERDWNQKATQYSAVDAYELPPHRPALITANAAAGGNPLEKGAYNKDRPWRRSYYDSAGYRYSSVYY